MRIIGEWLLWIVSTNLYTFKETQFYFFPTERTNFTEFTTFVGPQATQKFNQKGWYLKPSGKSDVIVTYKGLFCSISKHLYESSFMLIAWLLKENSHPQTKDGIAVDPLYLLRI